MEAETKVDPQIKLTLSLYEAKVLRDMMQNPRGDLNDESIEEGSVRRQLFNALKTFTEAHGMD